MINDEVGGEHLLIVHQPVSDTTTAFVAQLQGKTLTFEAADSREEKLIDLETTFALECIWPLHFGPSEGSAPHITDSRAGILVRVVGIPPVHSGLYFSGQIAARELIYGMAACSDEASGVAAQERNVRSLKRRPGVCRETSPWDFPDRPAETNSFCPWAENSLRWPTLPAACRPR